MKYMLMLLVIILCGNAYAQNPCGTDDLCVVQFNAGFNEANKVPWVDQLKDCDTKFIDIAVETTASGTYKIVVVPTIVIFKGEDEVGRFQANIMMQMEATKKDVQGKIDEIIMEDF